MSFNPFPIGMHLHVVTCFGDHFTGEVVTYEHSVKMLMLRCRSKDGDDGVARYNQCLINLDFCKDLTILQEAKIEAEPPARLNLQRLDHRLEETMEQRKLMLQTRNEYATPRGRQLFRLLSQQFGPNELAWRQSKIVVLQQLTIVPPYRMCHILGAKRNSKLLHYVQRLIEQLDKQANSN
ncbi:LSM12 homolog A [Drosophila nasuta]|uniref:LSM12 homolog A n=1 Tax=Drosophila nasuta TaxID=42062 RepID=UPI00295F101F|nr:LSM12 homolog A [Drosophila nasuta]